MSVTLTEQGVVDRRKTVSRRLGWVFLNVGDRLTLCRKVMGRRRADGRIEPLIRLAEVEVIDVRREPLNAITPADVRAECVPGVDTPNQFVAFFRLHMRCNSDDEITRIQWRYVDEQPTEGNADE